LSDAEAVFSYPAKSGVRRHHWLADPDVVSLLQELRRRRSGPPELLGNTPAVARRSCIDPRVFDRYLNRWTIQDTLEPSELGRFDEASYRQRPDPAQPPHAEVCRAARHCAASPPANSARVVSEPGTGPPSAVPQLAGSAGKTTSAPDVTRPGTV
jgi:hypothetical protein